MQLGSEPIRYASPESHGIRQADIEEGTALAFFLPLRGGRPAGINQGVKTMGIISRQPPQGGMKRNIRPSSSRAVVKHAALDAKAEHLLETKRLGTELHFIGRMRFRFAAFVLDREHVTICVKFHDITLPAQSEVKRANRQSACDANTRARLVGPFVRAFMKQVAFSRE